MKGHLKMSKRTFIDTLGCSSQFNDIGPLLASRLGVVDIMWATRSARTRGVEGVGTTVAGGGLFNVNTVTYVGKKCVVTHLGGPFTQDAAMKFLNAL
jgi:hypothetical protein